MKTRTNSAVQRARRALKVFLPSSIALSFRCTPAIAQTSEARRRIVAEISPNFYLPAPIFRSVRRSLAPVSKLILFVTDLFHPVDDFTVELFLNGDVCHGCGWRSAMPMLLAGRKPDHITGPDFLDRATPTLRPPESGCHNQCLTQRMGVPGGEGTRLKRYVCSQNTCRFGILEHRYSAHCTG